MQIYTARELSERWEMAAKDINKLATARGKLVRYHEKINNVFAYDLDQEVNRDYDKKRLLYLEQKRREPGYKPYDAVLENNQVRKKKVVSQTKSKRKPASKPKPASKQVATKAKAKTDEKEVVIVEAQRPLSLSERRAIAEAEAEAKVRAEKATYLNDLDIKIKEAKLQQSENAIKLQEVELKKKTGNSLDADKVYSIIDTWNRAFKKSLKDKLELRNDKFCVANMINKTKSSKHKASVMEDINSSSEQAYQEVCKLIKKFGNE